MKSFSTINDIVKAIREQADDSVQRHLMSLVHRDVRELIHNASLLEDTELNETYPLFEDNEHLFEDFIGGKVIFVQAIEDLSPLLVDGKYLLDRAERVGNSKMESLALITNDAGGDLYYVPEDIIVGNIELAGAIEAFRATVTAQLSERGSAHVE
jgi:hypothetical protein